MIIIVLTYLSVIVLANVLTVAIPPPTFTRTVNPYLQLVYGVNVYSRK